MSPRTLLVSTRNSAYQVLESLRSNRQKRHRTRTFLLEGVQPITRALEQGWLFDAVICAQQGRLSAWAADVVARCNAPTRYELTRDLLEELSGKSGGSELLAVVRMAADHPARIPVCDDLLAVVIDSPANPGNLGTLVRSCDALGAHGVIVTGHATDVYDPATITASRGSLFAVPVVRLESPAAVAHWVAGVRQTVGRCVLVGADEKGRSELPAHDFTAPTVLVLGNEARGLGRVYQHMCDALVRIPMSGSASSLNVSVAASIVLYEAGRQRRAASAATR
jgi:23S rRNA (uridine2479-2'-O)-methyltransferase